MYYLLSKSDGVHKVALHTVEDDDGEEQGDEHEDCAVEEAAPIE